MTAWTVMAAMFGTLFALGGSIWLFATISERIAGTPFAGMIIWGIGWLILCAHMMSGGNWTFP